MDETTVYSLSLQKKLIEEFKKKFYEKIGFYPEVIVHTTEFAQADSTSLMRIPLDELLDIFDRCLLPKLTCSIPNTTWIESLKNKTRIRDICDLRFMYYKIAGLMGYSWSAIGRSVRQDHSNVIHGINTLNNRMETDPRIRSDYYNTLLTIKQIIEDEYRHLQCAAQIQAESQSVVSDTLHE